MPENVTRTLTVLVLSTLLAGCGGTGAGGAGTGGNGIGGAGTGGSAAPASPARSAPSPSVNRFTSVREYAGVAEPVRLRIPEAGVDTALERVGLTTDGWVEAPHRWDTAGWYRDGLRPGQSGPAVIVGHIDSKVGPAVFHRLPRLRLGAAVYIDRKDGTTITFRVSGRRQVPKNAFPAAEVYADTLEASLVLLTCSGVFDPATGHYRDNTIVTAVME